ncbi:MAG: uracil-DNA glycosylase family protein [Sphingomonadaceae bacterium]|nr:uracil-DNA glycosylase family protein [Sphingomonadaceae bacterium]
MTDDSLAALLAQIRACRQCPLPHGPRPIVQAGRSARILIIGQAPGSAVHASGIPWDDPSGDRLRAWTGLDKTVFYDETRVAQMPMGFCYPGKGPSADLPPRPECAPLWHDRLRAHLPELRLTLLVGHHAQERYLPARPKRSMTEAVRAFDEAPAGLFPLPHPSWRSTIWMRKNPWFEAEVLPVLRARIGWALTKII